MDTNNYEKGLAVKLTTITDIKEFQQTAEKIPAETTLVSGTYRIDAKSLFGILSLNLSKPIILIVNSEYAEEFEKWEVMH